MKMSFVKKEFDLVFGLNYKRTLYSIPKIFLVSLIIIFFGTSFSEAAKKKEEKDCKYCEKYEKLKDWPDLLPEKSHFHL